MLSAFANCCLREVEHSLLPRTVKGKSIKAQTMNAQRSLKADTLLTGFSLQLPAAVSVPGQLIRRSLFFFPSMDCNGG